MSLEYFPEKNHILEIITKFKNNIKISYEEKLELEKLCFDKDFFAKAVFVFQEKTQFSWTMTELKDFKITPETLRKEFIKQLNFSFARQSTLSEILDVLKTDIIFSDEQNWLLVFSLNGKTYLKNSDNTLEISWFNSSYSIFSVIDNWRVVLYNRSLEKIESFENYENIEKVVFWELWIFCYFSLGTNNKSVAVVLDNQGNQITINWVYFSDVQIGYYNSFVTKEWGIIMVRRSDLNSLNYDFNEEALSKKYKKLLVMWEYVLAYLEGENYIELFNNDWLIIDATDEIMEFNFTFLKMWLIVWVKKEWKKLFTSKWNDTFKNWIIFSDICWVDSLAINKFSSDVMPIWRNIWPWYPLTVNFPIEIVVWKIRDNFILLNKLWEQISPKWKLYSKMFFWLYKQTWYILAQDSDGIIDLLSLIGDWELSISHTSSDWEWNIYYDSDILKFRRHKGMLSKIFNKWIIE